MLLPGAVSASYAARPEHRSTAGLAERPTQPAPAKVESMEEDAMEKSQQERGSGLCSLVCSNSCVKFVVECCVGGTWERDMLCLPKPSTMEAPSLCRRACRAARRLLYSFPLNPSGFCAIAKSPIPTSVLAVAWHEHG